MDAQTYEDILNQTINETYPKYRKQSLLKRFEKENLVYLKTNSMQEDGVVDLRDVSEASHLETCIRKSPQIISEIERAEIDSRFKHAVLFELTDFDVKELENLVATHQILDCDSPTFKQDQLVKEITVDAVPTKYQINDTMTVLKFSRQLTGFLQQENDHKRTVKYNVLLVIYHDLNVLEIRFDTVKAFLNSEGDSFYLKQIEAVLDWFEDKFLGEAEALNLSPIIESIKKSGKSEVYVSGQAMNLRGQKRAVLETGDNEEDVLPLLGELKELMKSNADLFSASPEIKTLLGNFILETEETADLPWLSLTWKNESKLKATKVKFDFNYRRQEYSLLNYTWNEKMEVGRMNDVTRYLIENRDASVDEIEDVALPNQ